MPSLSDLPADVLDKVVQNLNQFQATKLAPLHSKFQDAVKRKLYNHIFIYGDKDTFSRTYLMVEPSVIKIRESINNIVTNKWTVVFEETVKRHLSQMDASQPILFLQMSAMSEDTLKLIFNHFKSIKYFSPTRKQWKGNPESECIVTGSSNTFYNSYRLNGKWSNIVSQSPDKYDYIHKADIDLVEMPYFNQLSNLKQLCVHVKPHHDLNRISPCTLKLYSLKLYLEGSELEIKRYFDTSHIRQLCIDSPHYLKPVLGSGSLDVAYPLLEVMAIYQAPKFDSSDDYEWIFDAFETLNLSSHLSLNEMHINTYVYCDSVIPEVCKLTLAYPNTSINWWDVDLFDSEVDLLQLAISPRTGPSCVGFYWSTEEESSYSDAVSPNNGSIGVEKAHAITLEGNKELVVKFETPIYELVRDSSSELECDI
ncbi:hypothetical protein KGF57_002132 [Candida theae]|uniref:F-box domain-containing protein n=1 Tax=Candida theae TaxID=1198502 RepID=A0AAD5BGH0_9ASCO|nr:uncharacterized protein KGF57_002132 [Candida theae]KAI5959356.1 hypothetical protein KGF57_002132 [Candida theae]